MRAELRTQPLLDWRIAATIVVVAAIGALLVGGSSTTWFLALALVVLAGTGYCAYHWPRATLVGVALSTLLDPGVAIRMLPEALAGGPIGVSEPLLAVAGGVALLRVGRGGVEAILREPTFWLAAVFVGVSIASALANGTPPTIAAFGIAMTIDAMAIFFLWIALRPSLEVSARAIVALLTAVLVVAVFGIGQVVLAPSLLGFARFSPLPDDVGSITSFMGNPNLLAPILALLLPFPLFATLRVHGRLRALAATAAMLLLLALVLTFSRGAWAATAVGVAIGTLMLDWRALGLSAALATVAVVVVLVMPHHLLGSGDVGPAPAEPTSTPVAASASSEPQPSPAATPVPDPLRGRSSEEVRLLFLRDGLRIVGDRPALGVGPGRYGGAVAKIVGSPVYDEYGTSIGRLRTVHNFWLHLAGEVGILGLVPFLGLVVALIIRLVRDAKRSDGIRFVILAGAATAAIVVGVNNLTEMIFEGNIPAVLVWLVLGIGAALAPNPDIGIVRRQTTEPR